MPHFILRYHGAGAIRGGDVDRIAALPEVSILDRSSERMILVEAPEMQSLAAVEKMPDWLVIAEQTIPLPDVREKVRRPPDQPEQDPNT